MYLIGCVCGSFPFVYLFFPNVTTMLCWMITLILHSFLSHIHDEGNVLMLEHLCWPNPIQMRNYEWLMRMFCVEKPKRSALLSLVALRPWSGIGLGMPAHSVFSLSLLDRKTLEMYAMLEKFIPFLRRYNRCNIMSSATKCKWMWWEYLWNHVLPYVLCHVDGQWSRMAASPGWPPGQGPV